MGDGPVDKTACCWGFTCGTNSCTSVKNILSETSVYYTHVLEKPATAACLQKNGNIYRLHCVTSQRTSVLIFITTECYGSYGGLMFTNGLYHVCVCVHAYCDSDSGAK